jgi:folylpolyglutamate synthase/dihydropteroate synthase
MLPTLAILSSDITLTEFDHERCRQEEDYFLYLDEYKFNSDFKGVITSLISEYPDDIILITGSLAFAGLVSELFKKGELKYE